MSTVLETVKYTQEDLFRLANEYWTRVEESEGFNIEGIILPPYCPGLLRRIDCRRSFPGRTLLKLYAMVGLQRYNMLQGTNFVLDAVEKYNFLGNCVSSYYMTLDASDSDAQVRKTFQVRIDEKTHGILDLTVSIARPKDEAVTIKKPFVPHFDGEAVADDVRFQGELPDWPSDDAFNDTNRFYMMKESEWEASSLIFLYLELAVVACNKFILHQPDQQSIVANLKILKVAIETSEDVDDKLKAKCAHVYITFKGLAETRERWGVEIGEDVVRRVIIRRVLNEETGYLSLLGKFIRSGNNAEQSSVTLGRREKRQQSSKRPTSSGKKGKSSKKRSRLV